MELSVDCKIPPLLIVVNMFYCVMVIGWIFLIPFDHAPDEFTHFHSNVEFIANNHRLPVSGEDDRSAYKNCVPPVYGIVPCTYSYNIYPALNYITSAVVGSIVVTVSNSIEFWRAARLASFLWGLLYINAMFLLLKEFIGSKREAAVLALPFQLLPQTMYIACYINQDIHSLALATTTLWALVRWWNKQGDTKSTVVLAVSFGMLCICKYNYLPLAFFIGLSIVGRYLLHVKENPHSKRIFRIPLLFTALSIPLPLFFFGRNFYYYHHDFLGQQYMIHRMARYHALGTVQPLDWKTFMMLLNNWYPPLFDSFFGLFDYLTIHLPEWSYQAIMGGIFISWFFVFATTGVSRKRQTLSTVVLMAFVLLNFYMVLWNTLAINYQPQGRYIFSIIPVFAVWTGLTIRNFPGLRWIYLTWGAGFTFLIFEASRAFLLAYGSL